MSKYIDILGSPITLPSGITLPNRFIKCPMQETLAQAPSYHPPINEFRRLYGLWSSAGFGMIVSGQVQVDGRFLSKPGDVRCGPESLEEGPLLEVWKEWSTIVQAHGAIGCIQLSHPGRMSPIGAGTRGPEEDSIAPSVVPVSLANNWLEKRMVGKIFGTPREATLQDIDEAVAAFVVGALVSQKAGFKAILLHGAHGFLISQFLSPYTNRRTDDYGGSPEKRLKLLQRIAMEVREAVGPNYPMGVKLNSGDYMKNDAGLMPDEALEQVRWIMESKLFDWVELSGGNAEGSQGTSRLAASLRMKSIDKAPVIKESTRIREGLFDDFAARVKSLREELDSPVAIQLSGGFRSRLGMADAIDSGVCDLIGMGRAAVLQPTICRDVLLNPAVKDEDAFATPHGINGRWIIPWIPVKAVGASLSVQFFYYQMRRLGNGLSVQPETSLVFLLRSAIIAGYKKKFLALFWRMFGYI